ncbi:SRPBCC family protein [Jatrophihabitans sp. YIM 134969]
MPVVERTVVTTSSLDVVWPYLTDFTTVTQWDPNTPDSRLVEGEGEVGSKYAITSVFRKRTTHLEYVVTDVEPRERFVLHGENRTVSVVEDMRFAATPEGGTQVTYRAEFTFHGAAKLASPFLGGALEGIGDDAERGMQTALDAL